MFTAGDFSEYHEIIELLWKTPGLPIIDCLFAAKIISLAAPYPNQSICERL